MMTYTTRYTDRDVVGVELEGDHGQTHNGVPRGDEASLDCLSSSVTCYCYILDWYSVTDYLDL